jgi:hypothetical protein
MGERIILDIKRDWIGKHCETSALKTAFDHHGLELSEEMLFGLGGGIGFIYWYMKMMTVPMVGGRNGKSEDFAGAICQRLGARFSFVETASAAKGYAALKEIIRGGDPAVCYGDMVYLPYAGMDEDAHFGGHVFVVYGIDEDKNEAYIWDRSRLPFTVGLDDLARARGSKFPPFQPHHRLLRIEYPNQVPDLRGATRDAVGSTVDGLNHPPLKNFGLAGMLKWAGILPGWPAQFPGAAILGVLVNLFIFIEIGGTGGAAFRPMYARFLEAAAEITGDARYRAAAEAVRRAAEVWSQIAAAALPDDYPALAAIRSILWRQSEIMEQQAPGAAEANLKLKAELDAQQQLAAAELDARPPEFVAGMVPLVKELHTREVSTVKMLEEILK